MFLRDGRDLEMMPPTSAALSNHVLGMAGNVWYQVLPNAEGLCWKLENGRYVPRWTQLPEASIVVRESIKCGCNQEKGCSGRCKCFKAEFPCTELCKYNGYCERNI